MQPDFAAAAAGRIGIFQRNRRVRRPRFVSEGKVQFKGDGAGILRQSAALI